MQILPATNIIFSDNNGTIDTLITNIPSVLLYLKNNYQLQVKFVYPKSVSYNNLSFEKTYIKSFRAKANDYFVRNITPELELINCREGLYGFSSSEFAFDIIEDIINWCFTYNK